MKLNALISAALAAPASALLRFPCSQLSVQRLDPLVEPGANPSAHLHQIIGGNSFNVTMDFEGGHDLVKLSTCTTCQFTEDLSNYWTAVLFYMSDNGSFTKVPQITQQGMNGIQGGMVIYYMSDALFDTAQRSKVTAFKPGFRMVVGDPSYRSRDEARNFRQLTYTCMQNAGTRSPEHIAFPETPCPAGIMANHRFPTCWDGKNLDSPNHKDHVAYPSSGSFESGGPCPDTHPVRLPQLMFETVWDTRNFNSQQMWPKDGRTQPFVWSSGDPTGFSSHADYVFGWKDDSLQKHLDSHSYVAANTLASQSNAKAASCTGQVMVNEDFSGWLTSLPGNNPVRSVPVNPVS